MSNKTKSAENLTRNQYREIVHEATNAKKLGTIRGVTIYQVDGTWIRDNLDVDFASSGSFACCGYVPEGEVWVEEQGDKDLAASVVRELITCAAMIDGLPYCEAHQVAVEVEAHFRSTWTGDDKPIRAAETFIVEDCEEQASLDAERPEYTARKQASSGLVLSRSGYQRYTATWEGPTRTHKVWIGGDAAVEHGSYDDGRRQRRKTTWTVKVDGKEVGAADTLREARTLAEYELGIVPEVSVAPELMTVTASDVATVLPEVRGSPEFVAFMQDYLTVLPFQHVEDAEDAPNTRAGSIEITAEDLEPEPSAPPSRDPAIAWPPPAVPPQPEFPGKQFSPSEPWHLYTVKPGDWYASTRRLIVPEDEYERLQQPGRQRELKSLGPLKKLPAGTIFDMWRRVVVPPEKLEEAQANVPQVSTKAPAERRELEKRILPLLDPEQRKRLQETQDRAKETKRPRPKAGPPPAEFKAFNVTPNGGLANIIEVLKHAPQYLVDQQKDWYKVAHDDAQKLADAKGVPVDLVSGLIAILSPNTLWADNVFAAEQILSGRGREVIAFREYVDEKAITNWAMKIYPEVFTEKKTLGVMMYLPNIVKAQRALDAFAASGQNTWAVDVAQPVRLEWDTRKQVTAEDTKTKAPAKTKAPKEPKPPKPPKEPKPRKGVISIEEAERKYLELVARGWTARFVKPNARDASKVSWTQGAIVPLGAPFPRDAYGSRLVLNPPFKSGRTVNRKQPDGTRKPVTEDSPKITAFHESILDPDAHAETVVLDGHATNIWRGKPEPLNLTKQPQGEMAQTMREDYRKAARQSKEVLASVGVQIDQNLTPQQLQAVTWVLWSSALKAMPKKEREALFNLKGDDIGGGDFDEDSLEAAEALAHGELSEEPDETEPESEAAAPSEPEPEPEPPTTAPPGGKKPRAPRKPKTPKAGVIRVTAADLVAAWGPGGYELDTPVALESDTLREVRRRRKEDKPTWDRAQLPVTKRRYPPPRDWGPERSWRTTPSPEQKRPKVQLVPPSVDDDDPAKLRLEPNGGYENIVKVLSLATPEEVDYWGRWYLGAAHVVRQMAAQYKLPVKDVAGVVAVLSPGNKWHQNVVVAKQIIEWFLARREHGPWSSLELSGVESPEFSAAGADAPFFADEDEAAEEAWRKQRKRPDQRPYEFKFKDDDDEADDDEAEAEADESGLPTGAEALELKERKGPKEHPMGFFGPHPSGYPDNVKKALAILGGEDPDAVVTGPKVEVFYQSLLDPDYVRNKLVLDGHAINLWRGEKRPLKGLTAPSATERAAMLADYAKAAEAFGLTVQAVQAITWYIWKNVKSPKKLVIAHQRLSVNLAFPAKDKALRVLLDDNNIEYPADFQQADHAYRNWKQQYAKHRLASKPVWEGGELDAVNGWLSLRGDRRVSGLLEAWERLTVGVRSWADPKVAEAVSILRDVPGLEDLRLPEFVLAELSERDYARELSDAEAEADDFGGWTEERHARTVVRQARMRADAEPGESACVAIRVPPALARMWPADGRTAAGDDSPPHFTVLYLGPIEGDRREELVDIVRQVAGEHRPVPIELARGVSWFENHKGQQIAHKSVHPKTLERLEALHEALRAAVTAAGFEVRHKEPFIAHSTLAYCDDRTYRGSVPEGGWTSREVEVWGWPDDENIPLGSAMSRAAGRWKVPVALGGEPMIVTAGDLKHAAKRNRSKRKDKSKRFMGETYWLPKDSAFARTRSMDAGDDALEIRLEPDARVLHEGDRDLLDAGGNDAALEDVMKMALEKGYDAVRVKDRLAILNQDAIAERTSKVRPGWHR